MILVHRLRGEPLFINADLIESVESTPDTVVTLIDGRKLVVAESPEAVVEGARVYRASVLVATEELRSGTPPSLVLLAGGEESVDAEG